MDFIIVPNQSVGPIHFGMTPDQVRKILDSPYESDFFPEAKNVKDYFPDLSVGVLYDYAPPYRCLQVSLFPMANAIFQGRNLSLDDYEQTCLWLKTMYEIEGEIEYSVIFPEIGIILTNPIYSDHNLWLEKMYTSASVEKVTPFTENNK